MKCFMRGLLACLMTCVLFTGVYVPCAAAAAEIEVDTVSCEKGDTVSVDIRLNNNPGIASMKITVQYDATALELQSAEISELFIAEEGAVQVIYNTTGKTVFSWVKTIGECSLDGMFSELSFLVKDGAATNESITVSYEPDDIFDEAFNNVYFAIQNGGVYVKSLDVDVQKLASADNLRFTVSMDGFNGSENLYLIAATYNKQTERQIDYAMTKILVESLKDSTTHTIDVPINKTVSDYEWRVMVVDARMWKPCVQVQSGYYTVR